MHKTYHCERCRYFITKYCQWSRGSANTATDNDKKAKSNIDSRLLRPLILNRNIDRDIQPESWYFYWTPMSPINVSLIINIIISGNRIDICLKHCHFNRFCGSWTTPHNHHKVAGIYISPPSARISDTMFSSTCNSHSKTFQLWVETSLLHNYRKQGKIVMLSTIFNLPYSLSASIQ